MLKTTKTPKKLQLKDYYFDLNEANKIKCRDAFMADFEISKDSFYRIIRQDRPLKKKEKEFFAAYFSVSVNKLFPNK